MAKDPSPTSLSVPSFKIVWRERNVVMLAPCFFSCWCHHIIIIIIPEEWCSRSFSCTHTHTHTCICACTHARGHQEHFFLLLWLWCFCVCIQFTCFAWHADTERMHSHIQIPIKRVRWVGLRPSRVWDRPASCLDTELGRDDVARGTRGADNRDTSALEDAWVVSSAVVMPQLSGNRSSRTL